nr:glucosaminidase domain-containing protein [Paenibacillus roseus]
MLAPIAIRVRKEGASLFPSVRLAQNILETGGKIPPTNNLGGYKVGNGVPNAYWRGKVVNQGTWEVYNGVTVNITAAFRAYDSVYDFYKDQELLFQNARYEQVRSSTSLEGQAKGLQASGYATDPQYAAKLIQLIGTYNLKRYDQQAAEEAAKVAKDLEQDERLARLEDGVKRIEAALARFGRIEDIEAPSWAKDAAEYFAPYFDTKTGSNDFWRILTIMYRQQAGDGGKK